MRIALVSTQRTAVPPERAGSVELVVGLLAERLARLGHDITVFGPGDSPVPTRVRSVLSVGYQHDDTVWDWRLAEFMQLGLAYEHADEFDIINSHVYCYALPFTRLVRTPTVHTFHICPTPDFLRFCRMYPESGYVFMSKFQRTFFGDLRDAGIVYNGVDTASFPFRPVPGEYLAFLGDMRADKGPLDAIRCARDVGMPIRLAGPDTAYFREVIKPEVDGRTVQYVGEVDHAAKADLLGGARALFFLSQGLEACPLVLMEAMACGTPVLGLHSGPVPEIVTPGLGGICVSDVSELAGAVKRLDALDRRAIREMATSRFDISVMVAGYLRIFENMLERRGRGARP